ncbi:hypothetical protein T484DRAFT_1757327 [Baffinella frigidus]|nr:hypothetical protein T484DRAFT_1757327 [Cryptophyta sp. CCMP2293]
MLNSAEKASMERLGHYSKQSTGFLNCPRSLTRMQSIKSDGTDYETASSRMSSRSSSAPSSSAHSSFAHSSFAHSSLKQTGYEPATTGINGPRKLDRHAAYIMKKSQHYGHAPTTGINGTHMIGRDGEGNTHDSNENNVRKQLLNSVHPNITHPNIMGLNFDDSSNLYNASSMQQGGQSAIDRWNRRSLLHEAHLAAPKQALQLTHGSSVVYSSHMPARELANRVLESIHREEMDRGMPGETSSERNTRIRQEHLDPNKFI